MPTGAPLFGRALFCLRELNQERPEVIVDGSGAHIPRQARDGMTVRPGPGPAARGCRVLLLASALVPGLACEDVVVQPVEVESVVVDPPHSQLALGSAVQLTARGLDHKERTVSGYPVAWRSDDEAVATVDDAGLVTGHARGEATIAATMGGRTGSALVDVRYPPSLVLDVQELSFAEQAGTPDPAPADVAVTNGGDLPLEGLAVAVSYDDAGGWLTAALASSSAPTTLRVSVSLDGLEPGTYSARVTVEASSTSSAHLTVTLELGHGIPSPPSGLTASATDGEAEVHLSWTDNSDGRAGFDIERRGPGETQFTLLDRVDAGVVSHTDGTVAPDGTYVYRVAACGPGGCSAPSGQASATTHPVAPTALRADPVSESRIDLSWTDNSATETSFRLERRDPGSDFELLVTAARDQTSHSDRGLSPETTYTYRVQACNSGGCSAFAEEATATTEAQPPPAAPTGLTADVASASRIELAWTDNSEGAADFVVQRRVGDGEFAHLGDVGAGTTTLSDGDVVSDRVYSYRVAACWEADVCSAFSDEATAMTPPVAPTGFTAAARSASEIRLSWTDHSVTGTEVQIERQDGGSDGFQPIATVERSVTTFDDAGLSADTRYEYRIRSCNVDGCSGWVIDDATTDPPAVPGEPSGLSAVYEQGAGVQLRWTPGTGSVTEHRIERQADDGAFTVIHTAGADADAFLDGDAPEDQAVTYRVLACNDAGCSGPSNQATVLTPPTAPERLRVVYARADRVQLTWQDNSTHATHFRVERASGDGGFETLAETEDTGYQDRSVEPNTTYSYRVLACHDGGCSGPSNVVTTTTGR